MTEIVESHRPAEVLIAFDAAGRVRGAHFRIRHRLVRGDEVLKDEELPAQPIALDTELAEVLADIHQRALVSVNEHVALIAELRGALEAAAIAHEAKVSQVVTERTAQLQAAHDAAVAEAAEHRAAAEAAQAQARHASAEVARLQA